MKNINKELTAYVTGGISKGSVKVSGAKNAATRLLAAALISDEKIVLNNFPTQLVDAQYKIDFIIKSGGKILINDNEEQLEIDSLEIREGILDSYDYPIRTTYLLVAGLLKRCGIARIPYPGGCKIGSRGYDLHVMVWEKLGCIVEEKPEFIEVRANGKLKGNEIDFPISTIGGTENALICASTIAGQTIIKNAYISPEIESLIHFLRSLGVNIEVAGNSYIRVIGKDYLSGSVFSVIPDRIEALTWITLGIISGCELLIEDVPAEFMQIPLIHLRDAGIDFYQNSNSIYVNSKCLKNGKIQPFELACGTHPGIISDMQPFYVLLGLHADGISRVYDYRYPERMKYLEELSKFYPNSLKWERGAITITGNSNLVPAIGQSTDLRGSMAILMAALLAKGESQINNVEMALRGYNNLEEKLKALGCQININ